MSKKSINTRGQAAVKMARGVQTRGLLERMAQAQVNRSFKAEVAKAQAKKGS